MTTGNDARVLVCVVPRRADMERIQIERWYRLPLARAPQQLAADYLAFYQTAAHGSERWSIRTIARIERIDVVRRLDLLPREPDHPRAAQAYLRFGLCAPAALPTPLPSKTLRRLTFICTTLGALYQARDVADLVGYRPQIDYDVAGAGVRR